MNDNGVNEPAALAQARQIATLALSERYDFLLACRDLRDMRARLSFLPESVMDTFSAVASETDDLPIGNERKHWAEGFLRTKDDEAAKYRPKVRQAVDDALQKLVSLIDAGTKNS